MRLEDQTRFRFPLLACPVCTRWQWRRALCVSCAEALWTRIEVTVREEAGYSTRSLFAWRREEPLALAWWLHALKRKEHDFFWREAALWSLHVHPVSREPLTIIPMPSRHLRNHARGFAQALAVRTGWPMAEPLRERTSQVQKQLGREARQARELDAEEGFAARRVLLVDDVITTGATLRAAYRALGAPPVTHVWCLADRRPCGTRAALL